MEELNKQNEHKGGANNEIPNEIVETKKLSNSDVISKESFNDENVVLQKAKLDSDSTGNEVENEISPLEREKPSEIHNNRSSIDSENDKSLTTVTTNDLELTPSLDVDSNENLNIVMSRPNLEQGKPTGEDVSFNEDTSTGLSTGSIDNNEKLNNLVIDLEQVQSTGDNDMTTEDNNEKLNNLVTDLEQVQSTGDNDTTTEDNNEKLNNLVIDLEQVQSTGDNDMTTEDNNEKLNNLVPVIDLEQVQSTEDNNEDLESSSSDVYEVRSIAGSDSNIDKSENNTNEEKPKPTVEDLNVTDIIQNYFKGNKKKIIVRNERRSQNLNTEVAHLLQQKWIMKDTIEYSLTEEELQEHYRLNRLAMTISDEERQILQEKVIFKDGTEKYIHSTFPVGKHWAYLCHSCRTRHNTLTELMKHITGRKHPTQVKRDDTLKEKFGVTIIKELQLSCGLLRRPSKCNIELRIDPCCQPLIGIEYLVDFIKISKGVVVSFQRHCFLCDYKGNDIEMLGHIRSVGHYNLYLDKFFPLVYESLKKEKFADETAYTSQLKHVVGRIQFVFGRLKPFQVERVGPIDPWMQCIREEIENHRLHFRESSDEFVRCASPKHLTSSSCQANWKKLITEKQEIRDVTKKGTEQKQPLIPPLNDERTKNVKNTWMTGRYKKQRERRRQQYMYESPPATRSKTANSNDVKPVAIPPLMRQNVSPPFHPLIGSNPKPKAKKRKITDGKLEQSKYPTKMYRPHNQFKREVEHLRTKLFASTVREKFINHVQMKDMDSRLNKRQPEYLQKSSFGDNRRINFLNDTGRNPPQNQRIAESGYRSQRQETVWDPPPPPSPIYNRRNYQPTEEQMKHVSSKASDDNKELIAILRQMSVLEDYLGYLGPKILDLLSEALRMDKFSEGHEVALLDDVKNCVLLDTAKEKLSALVETGLIDQKFVGIAETVMEKISVVIFNKNKPRNCIQPLRFAESRQIETFASGWPSTELHSVPSSSRLRSLLPSSSTLARNSMLQANFERIFPTPTNFTQNQFLLNYNSRM